MIIKKFWKLFLATVDLSQPPSKIDFQNRLWKSLIFTIAGIVAILKPYLRITFDRL